MSKDFYIEKDTVIFAEEVGIDSVIELQKALINSLKNKKKPLKINLSKAVRMDLSVIQLLASYSMEGMDKNFEVTYIGPLKKELADSLQVADLLKIDNTGKMKLFYQIGGVIINE